MQISHKYKFIFFSNPKTGSETVRKILEPYSDEAITIFQNRTKENPFYSHMSPTEAKDIFQDRGINYDDYFKFVFVRNPWARLVSLYEMIYSNKATKNVKNPLKFTIKTMYKKVFTKTPDFKVWLETIENHGVGGGGAEWEKWRRYGTYSLDNYIMDDNKNILVDKVIKLENIQLDLKPTLKELGIHIDENLKLEKVNARKYQKYTQYYDKKSIDLVAKMYQYDISEFDYKFGE